MQDASTSKERRTVLIARGARSSGRIAAMSSVSNIIGSRSRTNHSAAKTGFGTNSDGPHITTPQNGRMAEAMRPALADAGLSPRAIGRGTASDRKDIAESTADGSIFSSNIPYAACKSMSLADSAAMRSDEHEQLRLRRHQHEPHFPQAAAGRQAGGR